MTTRSPIKVNLDDALLTISIIPYFWRYAVLPDFTKDTTSLGKLLRTVLTDEDMALKLVQLTSLFAASDLLVMATALLRCADGSEELSHEMIEAMRMLEEALARLVGHALSEDIAVERVTLAQADGDSGETSAQPVKAREAREAYSGDSFNIFGSKKPTNSMN